MNKNYLKYNNLGILVDSQLEEVSQGNHNVDYYYIAYDVYDYTNGYVTVSVTLPDGTQLPELATSPKEFEFEGNTYKGFAFVLRDALTAEAGTLSMTFNLKSAENDTQLCSSRLNVTIHESDMHTSPTITDVQYNQMQEIIRENTVKSEEALSKANDALYHDATIVKVNGEVQQTWDATYAQKITEESLNLLNLPDIAPTTINGVTYSITKGIIKLSGTATDDIDTYLIEEEINLAIGDYIGNNIGSDGLFYVRWVKYSSGIYDSYGSIEKNFKSEVNDGFKFKLYVAKGKSFGTETILKPVLVKGIVKPTIFGSYNSASHITNAEADLLKSEWEKSVNELYIENQSKNIDGLELSITNNTLRVNGKGAGQSVYFWYNNGSIIGRKKLKAFYNGGTTTSTFQIIVMRNGNNISQIMFNGNSFSTANVVEIDFDGTESIRFYFGINRSADNLSLSIMISEEETEKLYLYNGQIIHEKDIEPVLLWENGTTNNPVFEAQETIEIPLNTLIGIEYRIFGEFNCATKMEYVRFSSTELYNLSLSGDLYREETIKHGVRPYKLNTSGILEFMDCRTDNSIIYNQMCVPMKIWKFNY